jgi:hypothetical protein
MPFFSGRSKEAQEIMDSRLKEYKAEFDKVVAVYRIGDEFSYFGMKLIVVDHHGPFFSDWTGVVKPEIVCEYRDLQDKIQVHKFKQPMFRYLLSKYDKE